MSTDEGADSGVIGRVRRAMTFRKMSMAQLSDATGVPYRSLQNYLLGKHALPSTVAIRIGEALDVSIDWLLTAEPQRFDIDILSECLSLIEQVRVMSGRKVEFVEAADMFRGFYRKFYIQKYSLHEDSPLVDPLTKRDET